MPVRIPPPKPEVPSEDNNNNNNSNQINILNRYAYYRVPRGLGRESNSRDYDYFIDLSITSGKYSISKKNNYQLPETHLTYTELQDSDGVQGVVSTRIIEGIVFYYGGRFSNYATKCRSDSYLADIEHIEASPLPPEEKEKYIQDRPRIKGLWIQPLKANSYNPNDHTLINYYDPHGLNRIDMRLPSGVVIPANQGVPCKECGLCFKKQENEEFADLRGRAEYYLYMLITRVGGTQLKQPFPARIVTTSSAFSSVHHLLYNLSSIDPTKEIKDHLVRLTLKPVMGKNGQLPNCYAIAHEIIGEASKDQLKLVDEIIELNTYRPNNDTPNTETRSIDTTKKVKTSRKPQKPEDNEEDDFEF
jgi:hypothetical protein